MFLWVVYTRNLRFASISHPQLLQFITDFAVAKLAAEKRQWSNAVQLMESEMHSRNSYCEELRVQIENLQRYEVHHEQVVHELSEMKSNLDRARETNASLDNEVRALEHGRTQEQEKVQLLQARLEKNSQNEELVAHDMQASNCMCFVLMYLYSLSHFCEFVCIRLFMYWACTC